MTAEQTQQVKRLAEDVHKRMENWGYGRFFLQYGRFTVQKQKDGKYEVYEHITRPDFLARYSYRKGEDLTAEEAAEIITRSEYSMAKDPRFAK